MREFLIRAYLSLLVPSVIGLLFVVAWRWHHGYAPLRFVDVLPFFQLPFTLTIGFLVIFTVRDSAKDSPQGRVLRYALSVKLLMLALFVGFAFLMWDAYFDVRVSRVASWAGILLLVTLLLGLVPEIMIRKVWYNEEGIFSVSFWSGRKAMLWEEIESVHMVADYSFQAFGRTIPLGSSGTLIRGSTQFIRIGEYMDGDGELTEVLIHMSRIGYDITLLGIPLFDIEDIEEVEEILR